MKGVLSVLVFLALLAGVFACGGSGTEDKRAKEITINDLIDDLKKDGYSFSTREIPKDAFAELAAIEGVSIMVGGTNLHLVRYDQGGLRGFSGMKILAANSETDIDKGTGNYQLFWDDKDKLFDRARAEAIERGLRKSYLSRGGVTSRKDEANPAISTQTATAAAGRTPPTATSAPASTPISQSPRPTVPPQPTSPATRVTAPAPTSARIVFQTKRDGNNEIYVMNTDGSNQTNLTKNTADDKLPTWSPDGSKIAFATDRDGKSQIYVMNANGSGQTRLSNNSHFDSEPAWSPDGGKIAFASNRDGKSQIYLMNADGSDQMRLTNGSHYDSQPAWSPDGSKIAFASDSGGICVTNSNGGNRLCLGDGTTPTWSPDSSKIAFVNLVTGDPEIYVMAAVGSSWTRLTVGGGITPTWSPDGSRIAFSSFRITGLGAIYTMDANGSNQTRLTDPSFDSREPDWSPQNKFLAAPKPVPTTMPTPFSGPKATPAMPVQERPPTSATPTKVEIRPDGFYLERGTYRWLAIGTNWRILDYDNNFGDPSWTTNTVFENREVINKELSKMTAAGISVVRVNVLDSGSAFFNRGYNDAFRQDIQTFLELAGDNGIKVELTIADYLMGARHTEVFENAAVRQTITKDFLSRLLNDIQRSPKAKDALWGFDLLNEPEWLISETDGGGWNQVKGERPASDIPIRYLNAYFDEAYTTIKGIMPEKFVTVGVSAKHLKVVDGIKDKLDYFALHHYGWMGSPETYLKLLPKGKPWMLEEFPTTENGRSVNPATYLDKVLALRDQGATGALMWMWEPIIGPIDDKTDTSVIPKLTEWVNTHQDDIFRKLSIPSTPPETAKGTTVSQPKFLFSIPLGQPALTGVIDVEVDTNGNIYATLREKPYIVKLNATGNEIWRIGTSGSDDGNFRHASALTMVTDAMSNIYVADTENHRIQKFDSTGKFLLNWGAKGSGDGQFNEPRGITVDRSGNTYVADFNNHRIQKFDSSGKFLLKWGAKGSGDGQFDSPRGIAVDRAGNVYVADYNNSRIQKFDSSGKFLLKWGTKGDGNAEFSYMWDIAVDDMGSVLVADTGNHRIQKFDLSGKLLLKWGVRGSADAQFDHPTGIALDQAGNVYVADNYNSRIQKFDSSGKFLSKLGTKGDGNAHFDSPAGIARDQTGNVYVTEYYNNRIQKFDSSGKFLLKWGSKGSGDGQFDVPQGIAVDRTGNVYVFDYNRTNPNYRIQKFDSSGKFLLKWGSNGSGDGQFVEPTGITTDKFGNIYVADYSNRIQKFDSSGKFLLKWGSKGSGDGQFDTPAGIAADSMGNIYVGDKRNHRIQKFDSSGKFLLKWGTPFPKDIEKQFESAEAYFQSPKVGTFFERPNYIAVDDSGSVYVSDNGTYLIQKYDPTGRFLTWFGNGQGSGNGWFVASAMAVGDKGTIYVADELNHRVQVFGTPVSTASVQPSGPFVIFREDGEGLTDGQVVPGWTLCHTPPACATVTASSSVKKAGKNGIRVSGDEYRDKPLPGNLVGRLEVNLWMFPATDSNTNNSFAFGHAVGGDNMTNTVSIRINETNTWFLNTPAGHGGGSSAVGFSRDGWVLGRYSKSWTKVRLVLDPAQETVDVFLDDVQVGFGISTIGQDGTKWLSKGINMISTHSGRGAVGHASYFDDLTIAQ